MIKPYKDLLTIMLEQQIRRENFAYAYSCGIVDIKGIDLFHARNEAIYKIEEHQVKKCLRRLRRK